VRRGWPALLKTRTALIILKLLNSCEDEGGQLSRCERVVRQSIKYQVSKYQVVGVIVRG